MHRRGPPGDTPAGAIATPIRPLGSLPDLAGDSAGGTGRDNGLNHSVGARNAPSQFEAVVGRRQFGRTNGPASISPSLCVTPSAPSLLRSAPLRGLRARQADHLAIVEGLNCGPLDKADDRKHLAAYVGSAQGRPGSPGNRRTPGRPAHLRINALELGRLQLNRVRAQLSLHQLGCPSLPRLLPRWTGATSNSLTCSSWQAVRTAASRSAGLAGPASGGGGPQLSSPQARSAAGVVSVLTRHSCAPPAGFAVAAEAEPAGRAPAGAGAPGYRGHRPPGRGGAFFFWGKGRPATRRRDRIGQVATRPQTAAAAGQAFPGSLVQVTSRINAETSSALACSNAPSSAAPSLAPALGQVGANRHCPPPHAWPQHLIEAPALGPFGRSPPFRQGRHEDATLPAVSRVRQAGPAAPPPRTESAAAVLAAPCQPAPSTPSRRAQPAAGSAQRFGLRHQRWPSLAKGHRCAPRPSACCSP